MGVGWNWRCTESFRREDVEGQIWSFTINGIQSSEGGQEKRASDHPISEVVGFFSTNFFILSALLLYGIYSDLDSILVFASGRTDLEF